MSFLNWKSAFATVAFFVTAIGLVTESWASIQTYGFQRITANAPTNIASQLFVDVLDPAQVLLDYPAINASFVAGGADVLFVFRNAVGTTSNVHEVYFDDGTIMAQTAVFNSLGGFTNYTGAPLDPDLDPGNLPGGNNANPDFEATAAFGADTTGNPNNGLNNSADRLGIAIDLKEVLAVELTYADVIAALADGSLRLGLHVGSIPTDYSDSFINGPPTLGGGPPAVPEPMSVAVWSLLMGFAFVAKSRCGR